MKLEEAIKGGEVQFFSKHKHLRLPEHFGQNNWELVDYISAQSGELLTVTGPSIEKHVGDLVPELTDVIMQLRIAGQEYVHIDVDIDAVKTENNIATWYEELHPGDRYFHTYMIWAWGGFIGFPGFEFPDTAEKFGYHMKREISHVQVGRPNQLHRYYDYSFMQDYMDDVANLTHLILESNINAI